MKEYIRFGEIPDDECSGIYNNEGNWLGKSVEYHVMNVYVSITNIEFYYHINLLDIRV